MSGGSTPGGELILADVSRPAKVLGVHGTTGLTHWSCLARRAGLDGPWEAIEWASVPPGGVSGEHLHTRTEEIYFIVSGAGELLLDGTPRQVSAGDLALTRVGSRHGLRNVGPDPLNWLVIEILSPQTEAVVRGRPLGEVRQTMESTVVNLGEQREIDPRTVFASPLESIRIVRLEPGGEHPLTADGREHTVFVLSGDGLGTAGGAPLPLRAGNAVTLPLGAELRIEAGERGLEFFTASMRVATGGTR